MNTLLRKTLFAALFLLAAIGASAYDFEYEGAYYDVVSSRDMTCEITYKEYEKETETYKGDFIIPKTVKYGNDIYKVVGIGHSAFDYCSRLSSVTIPEGVTSIENCAFYGCSSLTSVTIPESVTSIGNCAFWFCSSLTSVTIPEGVTSIGYEAFRGCSALTSITIPESVTSIGDYAFYGCSSLTSITIPESVTSIGDGAFIGCSALTSITIPKGVTSIGNGAFSDCSSLHEIIVDDENSDFTSIKGALYSKDITELYCCPAGLMETSFTIPETVTSIGSNAFNGCSSLTSVTIPESVTSIGSNAFNGCSGLTSVTIPDGVTSIEYCAFLLCSRLTSVTIPEGVISIGGRAFWFCSSLTSITIPESVTSIGYDAFYHCSSLTSITIPESVTSIGSSAFAYCSGLTSITIPEAVTEIGEQAFSGCSLQLFEIANGTNPLVLSDDDFSSKELYIGRSIVTKSGTASSECQFIPSDMEKVTFSRYVESLDYIGMDNATKLKTVVALGKTPPTIADDFFLANQYDNATLYVPEGAMQAYMEAPGWRFFYNIVEGVPTGISQAESVTAGMAVTAGNGYIVISNAHGRVNVYDVSGALIHSANAEGNDLRIAVPGHGMYIVKAGSKTLKVAM